MSIVRLPAACIYSLNCVIGVIGNSIMITCFMKNQKFRSPCHILITLLCFCDCLNLCGANFYAFGLFADWSISQSTCYFIQIVPIFGSSMGTSLILMIGIDRYRLIETKLTSYVSVLLMFPFLFAMSILYFGFQYKDDTQVFCNLPASLNGAFQIFLFGSVFINLRVFSVYSGVYLSLKIHETSSQFKKVFHSIALTVVLVLLGWVTTTVWCIVTVEFVSDPELIEILNMYAGIPMECSLTTNVFVFYFINSDYRNTIRTLLGFSSISNSTALDSTAKVSPSSVV